MPNIFAIFNNEFQKGGIIPSATIIADIFREREGIHYKIQGIGVFCIGYTFRFDHLWP
jgi:hypothetical protein